LDWNDLKYLLALHRGGSLAAAAKELGVTKATISRRLAALEEAVRAQLFERTPNGVVITAAGRTMVAAAEEIEQTTASLDARMAVVNDAQPRGIVRFTAPAFIAERFVIPFLPELKQRYPELEVQLVGSNRLLNIAQREADLALRNVRPDQQSLTVRKLLTLGGCVYGSPLYLQRKGVPRDRESLHGHDLLVYEGLGGMPGFEWMREPPPGATIAFRANDPESLVSAAAAGLGLAAVPCLIGDANAALARVETLGVGRCDMFLVCPEELKQAPRVRATSDFVAELLLRHRAEIDPFATT
jgi:DNA-binding transcriptional LysR family regulator